ncbi:hypothetical protein A3709_19880 [Halioglobus sp. HI00S01]|uniref:site-specific DNA-methyltransferase n=1 Tax=Halioglobus sp. HI00S01 TaxID=1822214 RepID=UPI0007C24BFB|nr:site-specific DNA-methyltransferase [Halioglobus sp. HI00S01]KZX57885.1 hypothetical protein A3709_19880 [Halioglobus sp. HI00S01]
MPATTQQIELFDVKAAYALAGGRAISNDQLYSNIATALGISTSAMQETSPVGKTANKTSLAKRQVRWHQQTLKNAGVIERVEGKKGFWRLTKEAGVDLSTSIGTVSLVGYSTKLGAAVWGLCNSVFDNLDAPITLCVTSPPYLRQKRAYGAINDEAEYIDFLCAALEPVVKNLTSSGSIALNVSNDIFVPGSPERSLYRERLVLAMFDRLGLHKMDELVWQNRAKAPAPTQWASKTRQQLCVQWEPIYLLSPCPAEWGADNRRVLEPHTERYLAYLDRPEEKATKSFSDGQYRRGDNSFRRHGGGRIPRNVLEYAHTCGDQNRYKRAARAAGLPAHGAPQPLALVRFLVNYLSCPDQLVVDPFGGSGTSALAAELEGRRWITTDANREYVLGSASRFRDADGLWLNPDLIAA